MPVIARVHKQAATRLASIMPCFIVGNKEYAQRAHTRPERTLSMSLTKLAILTGSAGPTAGNTTNKWDDRSDFVFTIYDMGHNDSSDGLKGNAAMST